MITPAQFNIFVSSVNTLIGAAYDDTVPVAYDKLCETVPSAGSQNVYGWTGMLPKMRLWNGPRVVFEPAPQTLYLPIRPSSRRLRSTVIASMTTSSVFTTECFPTWRVRLAVSLTTWFATCSKTAAIRPVLGSLGSTV